MPYSPPQLIDAGNTASATSLVSGSYTLTAGSRVMLMVCYAGASDTTTTMTDTNGNTWAKMGSGAADSGGMYFRPWECKNVTVGGSTQITVNFSGSTSHRGMAGYEVSGLDTSAAIQTSASQTQTNPGTGTDAITSGTLTPTGQPAIVFGFVQDQGNSNAITDGTGFTGNACPNCGVVNGTSATRVMHKRITSTSNTAVTATSGSGATHQFFTAGFIMSEPVVASIKNLLLLGVG